MNGLMKTCFCSIHRFLCTLSSMKIFKHRNHNCTVFAKKIIARHDLDDNWTMFAREDAFLAETYPADILIKKVELFFHVVRAATFRFT